jgi:predicted short-subunit dehydrogenase-like oxidoreductase (DUF2520 family)
MSCKRVRKLKQEFYITEKEANFLAKKMQAAGIENKSAYLRKMALNGYIIRQDFTVLKKFIDELNRIGNNLNQITKIANTYGDIDQTQLKNIKSDMEDYYLRDLLIL